MKENLIKRTIVYTPNNVYITNEIDYYKILYKKIEKFRHLTITELKNFNKKLTNKLSTIDLTTIEDETLANDLFDFTVSSHFFNIKTNRDLDTNRDLSVICIDELEKRKIYVKYKK